MPQSSSKTWVSAALALLLVGWGANQFASLLPFYQGAYGFSQLSVNSMLGVYVAGLIPALLVGGRFSDRLGRKGASVLALLLTMVASATMIIGASSELMLYVGRLLAGVATGVAMAATSSWVKELSQPPWNTQAAEGSGARRASLFTAAGFLMGPVVSGVIANFAPAPQILPYVTHIVLCLPFVAILARVPETRAGDLCSTAGPAASTKEAYPGASRRFRRVVAPGAPWVFGAGTVGFAVVPGLLDLGEHQLLYATTAVALTLGSGVLVQPLARRLSTTESARASLTAMGVTVLGLVAAAATAMLQNLWLGLLASILLGTGYGLMLVAGMMETQLATAPEHLGSAMGAFYTLAYAGFLAPTVLAFFAQWTSETALLVAMVGLAVISFVVMLFNSTKHLSSHAPQHTTTG